MRVHFDESKATIRLEACLGDIAKVLEKRYEIRLRGVRGEIANVAGSLPLQASAQQPYRSSERHEWESDGVRKAWWVSCPSRAMACC